MPDFELDILKDHIVAFEYDYRKRGTHYVLDDIEFIEDHPETHCFDSWIGNVGGELETSFLDRGADYSELLAWLERAYTAGQEAAQGS